MQESAATIERAGTGERTGANLNGDNDERSVFTGDGNERDLPRQDAIGNPGGPGAGVNPTNDFFLDLDSSWTIFRELLAPAPRGLIEIQAELLFLDGQLVYHWRDTEEKGGGEHFKFVSPEQATRAFQQQSVDTGWLPTGLIRWGSQPSGNWFVRVVPPGYHTLTLTMLNRELFKLLGTTKKDLVQINVPMPLLIFAGVGSSYYVWAQKGQVPDPKGPLYMAPLPNLYTDGKICFGLNKVPEAAWDTLDKTWQLFIEEAPFNADLIKGKSVEFDGDIRKRLIALENAKTMQIYPAADLVQHKEAAATRSGLVTLDQAIDYYLKK